MTGDNPLSSLRPSRPVAPDFADRLESSLRVQHAAQQKAPDRSPWRQLVLLGPAVLLVLIASAVLVLRDDAPSAALELREAENVIVTLPDGTSLLDPSGLELREGVVVSVGTGGRAVIGDIELGAGSVVTVRNGELVTADPATTTTSIEPPDAPTSSTVAPTPVPPLLPADERDQDAIPDAERQQDPTRDIDIEPPATSEPRDRDQVGDGPTPTPTDTAVVPEPEDKEADVGPAEVAVDDTPERIVDLALVVRRRDGGVTVAWRATGTGLEGLRVVLLRTAVPDAPDPDWPLTGSTTIAAETSGSDPGEYIDHIPALAAAVRYRAVALVGDHVVARSAVQKLVLDRCAGDC